MSEEPTIHQEFPSVSASDPTDRLGNRTSPFEHPDVQAQIDQLSQRVISETINPVASTLNPGERLEEINEQIIEKKGAVQVDPEEAKKIAEYIINQDRPILESLISKLKDGIEKGQWSVILGDDRDGRVPALILGKLIEKVARQKGSPKPKTLFVAGGTDLVREGEEVAKPRIDELNRYMNELANMGMLDGRVLVVTEHAETAYSISKLTEILDRNNVGYDIATLTTDPMSDLYGQIGDSNARAYIGEDVIDESQHSKFEGGKSLTGLKDKQGAHATAARGPQLEEDPSRPGIQSFEKLGYRELVNAIRVAAYDFVDEIYEKEFAPK